ncbi:5-amino-6-(5-phosphoribosylamino)uracil reductase [Labilithrix luteola]|uniref:5-amino-6-(5-phosphoribosylamino)uracil reductase n=1 Tax=Labilithrix luteola TaxID=1391654 RepID=A0A0K1QCR0_9BACT|nr:dihydrofolate reductase family protein [Labilithrix luteola]AKV03571.1 5-amino-6-(5-phosphoribosylamino)uracil reductase [Labilithrix luteola]
MTEHFRTPLELLFERTDLPRFALPAKLAEAYGGGLGFAEPCVVANFVASVDGVVALPGESESGHIVSGGSDADRFVMGMLRTCADVVMVGAGTFRKAGDDRFDAASIYPAGAALFAEARRALGLSERPRFAVVTASGNVDPKSPALENGLVVTTARGEAALRPIASSTTEIVALASQRLDVRDVVALLRDRGARVILSEGGPSLFGELVAAGMLDELFVTTSPTLFGRFPNDGRKSLVSGSDLGGKPLELLGLRRDGSHLFSRYAVREKR